jgi:hypothetical protein
MSTTYRDKRIAVVELFRATPEVVEWVALQPAGAVKVHPFVRDTGMDPVLVGGRVGPT